MRAGVDCLAEAAGPPVSALLMMPRRSKGAHLDDGASALIVHLLPYSVVMPRRFVNDANSSMPPWCFRERNIIDADAADT